MLLDGEGRNTWHTAAGRGGGGRRGGRRGGRGNARGRGGYRQYIRHHHSQTDEDGGRDGGTHQPMESISQNVHPDILAYMQRWRNLVDLEQQEQQRVFKERLATWSLERLKREGLVLLGLQLQTHGYFFGKPVVRARMPDRSFLPFNRFGSGDLVSICRNNPLTERTFEGSVLERSRTEIKLVCDQLPPGLNGGQWRLDQGVNTVMYDRMRAAIAAMAKDPNEVMERRRQQQEEEDEHGGHQRKKRRGRPGGDDEDLLLKGPPGTWLRDVLLYAGQGCNLTPIHPGLDPDQAAALCSWLQLPELSPAPAPGDPVARLNHSQRNAAALTLTHRLSLLQGPPGTGKTSTIVRLIQMLKQRLKVQGSVLACAQSNVAVDNLLEGLLDCGVNAVRVGQPVKIREELRDHCLDVRIAQHPGFAELEQARQHLQHLRSRLHSLRGRDKGLGHRDASILRSKLSKDKEQLMNAVLGGAEVICCTCVGAGSDMLEGLDFPVVILDEGSQCCEPESLIPLMKASYHAVLVGDHCQLPPVVLSDEARQAGLSLSLFERLTQGNSIPSAMLQVQYRMHPSISDFPNRQFYNGQVADGVQIQDRVPPHFPFPAATHPVAFIESLGEEQVASGGSKLNRKEAELVQMIVMKLMQSGEPPSGIGVITPYTAQLQVLNDLLGSFAISAGDEESSGLEIKTVDGYQGREKDIIIFSTVRSNPQDQIGFLQDWRRMNVALTRARRALIVLGNSRTLRSSSHWSKYLDWLEARHAISALAAFNSSDW